MTIEEFITYTQSVIAADGLDGYLPTVVLETRRGTEIAVLEDVPQDVDVDAFAKDWAAQVAKNKDYYLAFRLDESHFKAVSRRKGVIGEQVVEVR